MKNRKGFLKDLLGLTLGVFLMSYALQNLLEPNSIAPGGITGFSVGLKILTGIPVYITNIAINLPLFIIGIKVLGADFGWKTFYATFMISFFLKILPVNVVTSDSMLASIFGGVLLGTGIGTVIRFGGTTGGSDTIGSILNKFLPFIEIPTFMVLVDTVIIAFAGYADKKIDTSFYSMIAMIAMTLVIRKIIKKEETRKDITIYTNKGEAIIKLLDKKFDFNIYMTKTYSMSTKEEEYMLSFIVDSLNYPEVLNLVKLEDENAQVIIKNINKID